MHIVGGWHRGTKHGYGRYKSFANIVYEGFWKSNKREGSTSHLIHILHYLSHIYSHLLHYDPIALYTKMTLLFRKWNIDYKRENKVHRQMG